MALELGLGLGLGLALAQGGGGGSPVLPTFAYQAETESITSLFSVAPTRRVKRSIDWAIKTLKNAGILQKHIHMVGHVGNDQQSSLINWASPGVKDAIIVGTPGFVANSHFAPASSARIRTQVSLTDIDPANVTIWYFVRNVVNTSTSDIGALGANGFGLSLCASNTSNSLTGRCGSANQTTWGVTGAGGDWGSGTGFKALTRLNNTNVQAYNGPVKRDDLSLASQTMQNVEIEVLSINNNGTHTQGARQVAAWGISTGLTEAEMNILANVIQQLDYEYLYGNYDTYDSGFQPAAPTSVDLVVYGGIPAGQMAAYEAKRQGLSVLLVAGEGEHHLGGMSASGLGFTDFLNPAKLGGLPRWIMTQMQAIGGKTATDFAFEPRWYDQILRGMFDPRSSTGLDIPVYWSGGVASVAKTGARITSFTTRDGRTFSGKYFIDASYEGDLMKASGVSTRIGREAQAEFTEPPGGFRGNLTSYGSDGHQYKDAAGNLINIDPYITPGNAGSGILPSLQGTLGVGTPATGTADTKIQAYNYRITATTVRTVRKPFPSTAPAGFNALMYEPLLRRLAADPTISMDDIFILNVIDANTYDLNANGGFSTDLWGASTAYPAADPSQRETIRQQHWSHILGLFYVLQYHADARVPAALRTEALTYGLNMLHYAKARPGFDYNVMPQLYVREAYRLDNDFMLRYDDMLMVDGTTPRSIKTITMASYQMDSHHNQSLADPNGGTPRIWNEGTFYVPAGSSNNSVPIPYEVILPRKAECENLAVLFGIAATHVSNGSYRMEFTAGQAGQSSAHATKIAIANSDQALQDVDYPTMRASILASTSLSGETAAVLDQVN